MQRCRLADSHQSGSEYITISRKVASSHNLVRKALAAMFSKGARWRRPQPSGPGKLAREHMPSCSGRTSRSASAGRCSRPRRLAAKSAAQAEIVGKGALAQVIVGHVDGRRVARKVVRVCHFSCDLAAVKMAQDDLKGFKTHTRRRASKHRACDSDGDARAFTSEHAEIGSGAVCHLRCGRDFGEHVPTRSAMSLHSFVIACQDEHACQGRH